MERIRDKLFQKKKGSLIENMLVMPINLVCVCAFMVIVFGFPASVTSVRCVRLPESTCLSWRQRIFKANRSGVSKSRT